MEHPSERASGIGSPGESKKTNSVTVLVILHEELVTVHNMCIKTPGEHLVENPCYFCGEGGGNLWAVVRPNTSLVVDHLLRFVVLYEHRAELNNIGIVRVELISSSIKAQNKSSRPLRIGWWKSL
jgi:hypothetical protein